MLYNYFKIAYRQLLKNKLFSALNIFGLATSLSVCLMLIMILSDQYGYDNFHEKKDRIFRVTSAKVEKGLTPHKADFATAPLSIPDKLDNTYPFIKNTVRLVDIGGYFTIDEKRFDSNGRGFVVDADFLNVFDFGWIKGNQKNALAEPRSIVLTETTAKNLFPYKEAVGQSLEYSDLGEFKITGIIPDPPVRSHIFFDYLVSYSSVDVLTSEQRSELSMHNEDDIWRGLVYLLLENKNDHIKLKNALAETSAAYSHKNPEYNYLFESQALLDVMPSEDLSNEIGVATPREVLYFLVGLGVIIILSACFNYMNLSIARSLKRAKEIGVRKVIGARKKDIVFQFLGESILIALLSLLVAIFLLEILIPAFYNLDPFVEEVFLLERTPKTYLVFFIFSLLVGLIAGVFPAFNISAFQPIQAIRQLNNIKLFSRVGIRKALITIQFALSLIFILTVIIVLHQQEHVLNADLGTRSGNLYNVRMNDVDYEVFAQKVRQLKGVEDVSASNLVILTGENSMTMTSFGNENDSMQLSYNIVSPNYIENMDIELIAGNGFPEEINSKGEQSIILNEKAVKRMGYKNPIQALGQTIKIDTLALSVIGVVKDFHHDNIWFQPIQPFGLRSGGVYAQNANIVLNREEDFSETVGAIRAIWDELSPAAPMSSFYLDERIYYLSNFFRMGSSIIGFVGALTIIIACLGLLGMVIYSVEGKVKEVGIRKILGASEKGLIWQLSKGFLMLLGIALIMAVPFTLFAANIWLDFFQIRITIGPTLILTGVGLMLMLGLGTVMSQTYFAAKRNPVKSLRSE